MMADHQPPKKRIRIISDGTARGTKVYTANGQPLDLGNSVLHAIEILPIHLNATGGVQVRLTIGLVRLDVDAEAETLPGGSS